MKPEGRCPPLPLLPRPPENSNLSVTTIPSNDLHGIKSPKSVDLKRKKKHHLLGGVQYRLQVYLRSSIRVLQKSLEHAYGKSEFLKMITCNDLDTSKIHLPRLIQNPLSSGIVVVTRFS